MTSQLTSGKEVWGLFLAVRHGADRHDGLCLFLDRLGDLCKSVGFGYSRPDPLDLHMGLNLAVPTFRVRAGVFLGVFLPKQQRACTGPLSANDAGEAVIS